MKPETVDFIAKARRTFGQARTIQAAGVAEVAARTAYLAGFDAAQALIFERFGRTAKTHNGVHSQFSLAVRQDDSLPPDLRSFLSRTYEFKAIADYGVGEGVEVTSDEAAAVLIEAERLLLHIEAHLAAGSP